MDKKKFFKYAFGCLPEIFPDKMIISPFIPLKYFEEFCEVLQPCRGKLYSCLIAEKNGERFCIVNSGMGATLAGDAVLLSGETRIKDIIFLGACGGLNEVSLGDLLICTAAFNGEGFSRYYEVEQDIGVVLEKSRLVDADEELSRRLIKYMRENSNGTRDINEGKVFTIGSFLAEDRANLEIIKEKKFAGVDLELSAVYKAAEHIGRKASGILYVSDLPLEVPMWAAGGSSNAGDSRGSMKEIIKYAVDFIGLK